MKKVKCIHFNTCVATEEHLCSDPRCPLNKSILQKEDNERLELIRKVIDDHKKE